MRVLERIEEIDFEKGGGLVPAIVQDHVSNKVLMLGYMNKESLAKTIDSQKATFYSRSRKQLWTKGETSGNFLEVKETLIDCDSDTILLKVIPKGPVCHKGDDTCFDEDNDKATAFLNYLTSVIQKRREESPDKSYVAKLFSAGINKVAQKVGEEAVELVIEAKDDNEGLFLNEAADLLFHYMLLLEMKGKSLKDVVEILKLRHNN